MKTFIVKYRNFGLLTNLTNLVQLTISVLLAACIMRKMNDESQQHLENIFET